MQNVGREKKKRTKGIDSMKCGLVRPGVGGREVTEGEECVGM